MKENEIREYTIKEKIMIIRLKSLNKKWLVQCLKNSTSKTKDDFVFETIYPQWTEQPIRILFMGREVNGLGGQIYNDILYDAYKDNYIGGKHINKFRTHYLQFYITYALINQINDYSEIPCASELTKKFGNKNGISFSTINFSKISNETNVYNTDYNRIHEFIKISSNLRMNFWAKQIKILNPDVIVGMNLSGLGQEVYGLIGRLKFLEDNNGSKAYLWKIDGWKEILLIDSANHFSAIPTKGITEYDFFVNPIIELVRNNYKKRFY